MQLVAWEPSVTTPANPGVTVNPRGSNPAIAPTGGSGQRGELGQSKSTGSGAKITGPTLPELEVLPVEQSPRRNGSYVFAYRVPALLNAEQDSELMSLIVDDVEVMRFPLEFENTPN